MAVRQRTTVQVSKFTAKIELEGRTPRTGDGAPSDKAHGVCNYESPNRKIPEENAHGIPSRKGLRG